jgi:3-methyladenine DNA glycosylase AlkD
MASAVQLRDLEADIRRRLDVLPQRTTATVRVLRRDLSRSLGGLTGPDMIALALRLLVEARFETRLLAYELVYHHRAALVSLRADDLLRLGDGLDSWGLVDCFACYLSGPAWRECQVPDRLLHRWARSPDRWWRCAALVSTVPLNNKTRGGAGDASRTLAVCALLVEDRDDMVVKALSWALCELAKRDPESVRKFLTENEESLASRVLREVRNKLHTGLKNPRRRS